MPGCRNRAAEVALCLLIATRVATLGADQQPTFRSGVDLVTVDAVVLGREGNPIANLQAEDFVVKVDGRPRRVMSAQFVSQTAPASRPRTLAASHFTTNEDADAGRVVIVAVDEPHIRRLEGRKALNAAGAFIDRLDPADRIGVTGLARLDTIELTRDRLALRRKLDTLTGETDPVFLQFNIGLSEALAIADGNRTRLADAVLRECGRALTEYLNPARAADDAGSGRDACPEQLEQEAGAVAQHARTQARISLAALKALLDSLKEIQGSKTVVLLSEGLVADPRLIKLDDIATAAQEARVTIYVLQLEVPTFE
ncbi:MAG TPA: VWA domain-containing protein, partial [Vicinamibacterales bacterium]|nr:VWA domain-containing protein [Vicinamibacterales bacterium]